MAAFRPEQAGRRLPGLAVAVALLWAGCGIDEARDQSVDNPPQPQEFVDQPGTATTSQIAIVTEDEEPLFVDDGSEYAYIIIRDSLSYRLEELREAHPESKILLYKNASFLLDDEGCEFEPLQGSGLSPCQAEGREDWYLHDSEGERLRSEWYEAQTAMNIAEPSYAEAWREEVGSRLEDAYDDGSGLRYDGVWVDDANLYPGHGLDGRIAELTDDEYGPATIDFMTSVSSDLEARGFVVAANVGRDGADPSQLGLAVELAGEVSLFNRESFMRFGDGPFWTEEGDTPGWDEEITLAERIQAAGADFHAITYGSNQDLPLQTYARASFLMAWNGEGGALAFRSPDGSGWVPGWTVDLGEPRGDRYQDGDAWRRDFAEGTAIVNPTGSEMSVMLERPHRPPGGECTGSFSLDPASALLLERC